MLDHARRPGAAAGNALVRALVDPRRHDDRGSAAATRPRATSRPTTCAGTRRISSPTARCPAASTRAAPIPCPRTTARASSSSSPARSTATRSDRALLDAHVAARRGRGALHGSAAPERAHRRRPAPATHARIYGLMPASISHEGYSAKPMHSYWDDFWALKGYDARRASPRRSGARTTRAGSRPRATSSARDLAASLRGDGGAPRHRLPARLRRARRFRSDVDDDRLRARRRCARRCRKSCVHADVRAVLERVRRAARRPRARGTTTRRTSCATSARSCGSAGASARTSCSTSSWRAAARRRGTSGPKSSGAIRASRCFIGDLPHAWVASDYIRSVLDLFAYERERRCAGARRRRPRRLARPGRRRDQRPAHAVRNR